VRVTAVTASTEIEGAHGGKRTPVHVACVIGDTVGDPFKDTSGPSLNILIKLMSIISLTMAPLMSGDGDWPGTWYIGLVCIILLVVGTYLVYHFFWKNVDTACFTSKDGDITETARAESAKSSTVSLTAQLKQVDVEAPEQAPEQEAVWTAKAIEGAPTMDST